MGKQTGARWIAHQAQRLNPVPTPTHLSPTSTLADRLNESSINALLSLNLNGNGNKRKSNLARIGSAIGGVSVGTFTPGIGFRDRGTIERLRPPLRRAVRDGVMLSEPRIEYPAPMTPKHL